MRSTTTVVIGAGHAGLAMSRCLTSRSIDHVVLERGTVANTWKTERWDSLRLLTPNWQSRLPDYRYDGRRSRRLHDDARGHRVHRALRDAHRRAGADRDDGDLGDAAPTTASSCETDQGDWARADGRAGERRTATSRTSPRSPRRCPPDITMITPSQYRTPEQLEEGGVMVVGAAATGIQLADEIQRSGRPVTLAVGGHVRSPRVYRGMDIQWWMDVTGLNDERYDEVDDVTRVRKLPSFQLAGTPDRRTIDLNALTDIGVQLVGKFAGINDGKAQFSGSLRNQCALADLKLGRLLDTIDEWAATNALDREIEPPQRFEPTRVDDDPAPRPRPAQRRDPDDHLGDGLPARLLVARHRQSSTARATSATTAASSTRRRACT